MTSKKVVPFEYDVDLEMAVGGRVRSEEEVIQIKTKRIEELEADAKEINMSLDDYRFHFHYIMEDRSDYYDPPMIH